MAGFAKAAHRCRLAGGHSIFEWFRLCLFRRTFDRTFVFVGGTLNRESSSLGAKTQRDRIDGLDVLRIPCERSRIFWIVALVVPIS